MWYLSDGCYIYLFTYEYIRSQENYFINLGLEQDFFLAFLFLYNNFKTI